ncbi:MAG: hypothetical protein B7Z55_07220 [Planctomycetales bacterium 12-60-4]|nr:MAG: hypothetical protein B7Z55_07220 [Planctomycetales bacterium 12-60-4]
MLESLRSAGPNNNGFNERIAKGDRAERRFHPVQGTVLERQEPEQNPPHAGTGAFGGSSIAEWFELSSA